MTDLIPIFTNKASHNKWPKGMGLCPFPMFSKTWITCTFLCFYIFSHLFSFRNNFLPFPIYHPFFFKSPQPCFHKSYPQSKIFIKIRAVPSSAVFCRNALLITTPSCSMRFFSFYNVLPSAPTTTGMTLMLLMSHVLLISVFSSGP